MKSLSLILFLAIAATPGCSHFSSSARQQRAYAKYVRKSATVRQKQQKHFVQEKSKIPPATAPSDWQVTAEAVSSDSSNQ